MYLERWELPERPFESVPDARFYFGAAAHEGALAQLYYAVENKMAGALLWGPPGSGKTLVLDVLRSRLDQTRFYIANVSLAADSPAELLYSLLAAMGETELSPLRGQVLEAALHARLQDWLRAVGESGRHTVAILDDAHLLRDRSSLETVRLLMGPSRSEDPQAEDRASGSARLLTVILAGQEELAQRVARFTPLDERIEVKAGLAPLAEEEAMAYLLHRISVAGGKRGIFTKKAARSVARGGRFLPGPMNRLAEMCLVTASAAGLDRVGPEVVEAVLAELDAARPAGSRDDAPASPGSPQQEAAP